MKVLVACEFSGIVREAFRRKGHDAWSCDYRATEIPGNHLQTSVLDHEVVTMGWDLMIAHPDCTFLTVSGARWMRLEWREEAQLMALHFVRALWKFPVKRIAIENPVGKLSSLWRGPDQIIQPWQFGEDASKSTCLWLKGLPELKPTNVIIKGKYANQTPSGQNKLGPSLERRAIRARTYQGIADAMATQWAVGL
jgi:hypothetical protein